MQLRRGAKDAQDALLQCISGVKVKYVETPAGACLFRRFQKAQQLRTCQLGHSQDPSSFGQGRGKSGLSAEQEVQLQKAVAELEANGGVPVRSSRAETLCIRLP